MRVVQVAREGERRAGFVDGETIRLLDRRCCQDLYSLAIAVAKEGKSFSSTVQEIIGAETLDYLSIYAGRSDWRLLPPFDHPLEPARCMVSGTGLTHKKSAEHRAAMHDTAPAEMTDSFRMYALGLEGGSPKPGQIGVQPEWFFKGNGSILRAHGTELVVPPFAWDGGEEPEIAGVYVIGPSGEPLRVGLTIGNEFSDHRMETKNYLYLAPSKLRNCSIGPELTIGDIEFEDVPGRVTIFRKDEPFWTREIRTGQKNMCHSLANLEHHHFKYEAHRRPGDVHIHFFGADAFSFGDGVVLESGDIMEICFPQFGKPLRNPLRICMDPERLIHVKKL
jgi:hypothetical protein